MYVQAILLDLTACEFTFIILYSYIVFLPKFIVYDNFLVSYFILMLIYVQDMWQY